MSNTKSYHVAIGSKPRAEWKVNSNIERAHVDGYQFVINRKNKNDRNVNIAFLDYIMLIDAATNEQHMCFVLRENMLTGDRTRRRPIVIVANILSMYRYVSVWVRMFMSLLWRKAKIIKDVSRA